MYVYKCFWLYYWLHWVHHMGYIYWHSCLICAYEVIGICDIYVAFEGYICYCHIYGYSMVNESCSMFFIRLVYAVLLVLYVD